MEVTNREHALEGVLGCARNVLLDLMASDGHSGACNANRFQEAREQLMVLFAITLPEIEEVQESHQVARAEGRET